jgi:hypothetical protein
MDFSAIKDVIQYGSVANKEKALQEKADAEKRYQDNKKEMEKQMKEAGKSQDEIQKKVWTEQSQQTKQQKEKIDVLKKLTDWWQSIQPKETPKETPTPTTTPTPEVLGEFINMLGLGSTWATQGKPDYPDSLVPYANEAGSQYGIDPRILASQDAQETGGYGYEAKVGSSGEQGIPQIIPRFHYQSAGIGDSNTYASKLANDPKYAIGEQARILSGYLKGQGNIYDALRQYNAGSNLDNSGEYADEILKRAGLEKLIPGYNI